MMMRSSLERYYVGEGLSVAEIAKKLRCSQGQVNYWLAKYNIQKRSISEAIYKKRNPTGDPFVVMMPKSKRDSILFGVGIGLYWGEGTKANKTSVRLGNSDPRVIKTFITFLVRAYGVDPGKLRFGLQVFDDMSPVDVLRYWSNFLGVPRRQFLPTVIVTPRRGVGNYRKKTKFGVLTLYFHNKKLRDILCKAVDDVSTLI